jgi:hypothetical protein
MVTEICAVLQIKSEWGTWSYVGTEPEPDMSVPSCLAWLDHETRDDEGT